jgi:hypothetical protein
MSSFRKDERRDRHPSTRPFLTRAQLCELVGSWTAKTVSRLIEKGVLRRGEHFFLDPRGRGYLFRWDKVVDLIESPEARSGDAGQGMNDDPIPMLAGGVLGDGRKGGVHGL